MFTWSNVHWYKYNEFFTIQKLSQLPKNCLSHTKQKLHTQNNYHVKPAHKVWDCGFYKSLGDITLRKTSPSFLWVISIASSLNKSPSFKRSSPQATRSIEIYHLKFFRIYYKHSCTNVSIWRKKNFSQLARETPFKSPFGVIFCFNQENLNFNCNYSEIFILW